MNDERHKRAPDSNTPPPRQPSTRVADRKVEEKEFGKGKKMEWRKEELADEKGEETE